MIALTRLLLVVRKRLTVMVIGNALVCLGAMAFSHSAHAYGEVSGGLITSIYVNQQYGAVAYIRMSGTIL
jgi:hypothetical protein